MKSIIITVAILISVMMSMSLTTYAAPRPYFYAAFPAPSSDTRVIRDFLGNQATSYAYQDGHSSSVALSRSDVSKHLFANPIALAPAPVVYSAPPSAPLYHTAAIDPAFYPANSYQYHHQYPSYATAYHTAYPSPGVFY